MAGFDSLYYLMEGLSGIGEGLAQGKALRAQGEYQARMLELNAKLAEFQAHDSIRRGEVAAGDYQKRVSQIMGAQRVAYAAQGIQLGEGSAAEVATDTAEQAARDVVTIRTNAWREAWGYKVQAQDYRGQARYTRIASRFNAQMSEIGGITDAINYGTRAVGSYASDRKQSNLQAGRQAARTYFDGSSEGLSHAGLGSGSWGRMRDGSYGYGYQSMWG